MHNIVSQNRLAGWKVDSSMSNLSGDATTVDQIDDYFACLIECEDLPSSCKRICSSVFTE